MNNKYFINLLSTIIISVLLYILYNGLILNGLYIESDFFDGDTSTYISNKNHETILVNDKNYIEKCGIYGGSYNSKTDGCSEILRSDFAIKYEHTLLSNINRLSSTFHHHFQLIFPASEYLRGVNFSQIESMYGLIYIPTAYLSKLFGRPGYVEILRTSYIFFLVYPALLIFFIYLIFRDYLLATFVGIIWLMIQMLAGYEYLNIGIGYNPIRHFFDVVVFYLYYKCVKEKKLIYFISFALISLVQIFLNFHFGLLLIISCFLAFSTNFFIKNIDKKSYFLYSFICILIIFISFIWMSLFKNNYLPGMLIGVVAFPIYNFQAIIFLFVVILYAHIIYLIYNPHQPNNFQIFILFYFYFLVSSIYWLKTNNYDHLLNYLSCNIFSFIVIFHFFIHNKKIKLSIFFKKYTIVFLMILASCLVSYLFLKEINKINGLRMFSKSYQWKLGGANFTSNMNPEGFKADLDLISRYSAASVCLTVLSEYDTLFLFLMNKTSCLGSYDLGANLFNDDAIKMQIAKLNKIKPNVIYVAAKFPAYIPIKHDYKFSHYDEVYKGRIATYIDKNNSFNIIFEGLSSKYILLEHGQRLDAYKIIGN